jgi:hypothetical protein
MSHVQYSRTAVRRNAEERREGGFGAWSGLALTSTGLTFDAVGNTLPNISIFSGMHPTPPVVCADYPSGAGARRQAGLCSQPHRPSVQDASKGGPKASRRSNPGCCPGLRLPTNLLPVEPGACQRECLVVSLAFRLFPSPSAVERVPAALMRISLECVRVCF